MALAARKTHSYRTQIAQRCGHGQSLHVPIVHDMRKRIVVARAGVVSTSGDHCVFSVIACSMAVAGTGCKVIACLKARKSLILTEAGWWAIVRLRGGSRVILGHSAANK
jgi:hypothetical protein